MKEARRRSARPRLKYSSPKPLASGKSERRMPLQPLSARGGPLGQPCLARTNNATELPCRSRQNHLTPDRPANRFPFLARTARCRDAGSFSVGERADPTVIWVNRCFDFKTGCWAEGYIVLQYMAHPSFLFFTIERFGFPFVVSFQWLLLCRSFHAVGSHFISSLRCIRSESLRASISGF